MQAPTRVVAIRHGETAWNAATRIQGHTDIPLNERGRLQAKAVAEALTDEGLVQVYASDLSRAQETAAAIAERTGTPLRIDTGLRERGFGEFEGHDYESIRARWPEGAERWRRRDPDFGPSGGETLQGFYERCVQAALRLASQHPGESIALVAHGGVLDCLYRAATGQSLAAPRTWHLGNATVNRLLWTPSGFSLVGWNDAAHLDALDDPSA